MADPAKHATSAPAHRPMDHAARQDACDDLLPAWPLVRWWQAVLQLVVLSATALVVAGAPPGG